MKHTVQLSNPTSPTALATPIVQNNGAKQPHCSGAAWGSPVKQRAAWGPVMKNTRAMKHTLELSNPTSPLGSGGLAWYICFHPLFFSTLRLSTLWGEVYFSPYPLRLKNGPGSRCTGTPECFNLNCKLCMKSSSTQPDLTNMRVQGICSSRVDW